MSGNAGRLRRFYIPPRVMDQAEPQLEGSEARHVRKVLRMKVGDPLEVFDGQGRRARAQIAWLNQEAVGLKFLGEIEKSPPPGLKLVLAPALIRREKMKLVFQKAVELGVSALWPFESARSVVRVGRDPEREFLDRYQRVLIEAMKQCGSDWLPYLAPPSSLEEVLARVEPGFLRVLLWEQEARRGLKEVLRGSQPPRGIVLLVGPEGGFASIEVETAQSWGFQVAGLGPKILRAETAAIVALSIAQYEWGYLG